MRVKRKKIRKEERKDGCEWQRKVKERRSEGAEKVWKKIKREMEEEGKKEGIRRQVGERKGIKMEKKYGRMRNSYFLYF